MTDVNYLDKLARMSIKQLKALVKDLQRKRNPQNLITINVINGIIRRKKNNLVGLANGPMGPLPKN